jgi:hypothetical protein
MSLEACELCNQDSTPWVYINGHICEDCYSCAKRSGWIYVNNDVPFTGQEILFCSLGENRVPTTFGIYLGDKFSSHRFYSHDNKSYNATHWMSLPEPPEVNSD